MKKSYGLEIVLLLLFVVFEVMIFKSTDYISEEKIDGILAQRLGVFSAEYKAINSAYIKHADLLYEEVINSPKIISILEKLKDADESVKSKTREELRLAIAPTYQRLKKYNIRQLHFHLPNSESFLRMHKPSKSGDTLIGIRHSVDIANNELKRVHGFEEGRVFNGFRNVYPIFSRDGVHLGSVEVSLSFVALKEEIEKITESYVDFVIKKEIVEKKVWGDFRDFYTTSRFSSEYLEEIDKNDQYPAGITKDRVKRIIEKTKEDVKKGIESKDSFALFADVDNKGFVLTFQPITNIDGERAAAYLYSIVHTDVPLYIERDYFNVAFIISTLNALIFFFIYLIVSKNRKLESQRYLLEKQNVDLENANRELATKERELSFLNDTLSEQIEHEVAERMKVIKESESQKNIMYQQSRMAETGSMISAIAHQWKQPLNALSMTNQLLRDMFEDRKEEPIDDKEVAHYFAQIDSQISFMSQTIDDFRNFFKPSKSKEEFTPCVGIGKIVSMYKNEFIKNNVEIVIHEHEHLSVSGYPNEFMQAVLIIFNNAKDAILEHDIKNGKIECSFGKDGRFGVVKIKDNGGGIPEFLLPKLFDAYVTTKGEKGTGIGLQIAKSIIEDNMKGSLKAQNIEGGAMFTIKIPLAKN
ncbi:MAG: ATP-binding protein [Campylobacterales bacterium]